ncbi:hypothetical protein C8J57DRAFT_1226194 [Mycena rebaudengoi]|nr:hypothetical protein C8J57DRAFT_1226194 [Mycena rebaudengoi]
MHRIRALPNQPLFPGKKSCLVARRRIGRNPPKNELFEFLSSGAAPAASARTSRIARVGVIPEGRLGWGAPRRCARTLRPPPRTTAHGGLRVMVLQLSRAPNRALHPLVRAANPPRHPAVVLRGKFGVAVDGHVISTGEGGYAWRVIDLTTTTTTTTTIATLSTLHAPAVVELVRAGWPPWHRKGGERELVDEVLPTFSPPTVPPLSIFRSRRAPRVCTAWDSRGGPLAMRDALPVAGVIFLRRMRGIHDAICDSAVRISPYQTIVSAPCNFITASSING